MTRNNINITIAKFLGWTNIQENHDKAFGHPPKAPDKYIEIPDFYNDLNAIHAAENQLNIDQEYNYGEELRNMSENVGPKGGHFAPNGWGCFSLANLTAKEKAKALVAVISRSQNQRNK